MTKVDSEWITSYLASDEQDWMTAYWAGKTLGARPLTEIIASGIGLIQNQALRVLAYQSIIDRWPTATPLLAMASCAFKEYKLEDIALIKPAITAGNDGVSGRHYIDIRDLDLHEKEIISALHACKKRDELPPMTIPNDGASFFSIPDMTHLDFDLVSTKAGLILKSVHDAAIDV